MTENKEGQIIITLDRLEFVMPGKGESPVEIKKPQSQIDCQQENKAGNLGNTASFDSLMNEASELGSQFAKSSPFPRLTS